jgi:hypothetical protein
MYRGAGYLDPDLPEHFLKLHRTRVYWH